MVNNKRYYVDLVSFDKGVITVVKPDGQVGVYVQRGVHKLDTMQFRTAVGIGMLRTDAKNFTEFPREFTLVNERPDIMGEVRVTFNLNQLAKTLGK